MVLLIIIPMKNCYFIGNIPYFQTNPFGDNVTLKNLGPGTIKNGTSWDGDWAIGTNATIGEISAEKSPEDSMVFRSIDAGTS